MPGVNKKVLAISGGVGGAKLALGLSKILPSAQLVVVANTGDDFRHLGLSISPDLDTLMYTLAGLNNQQQGWGLADESWQALSAIETLGGETWFRLGDRDLATHLLRTQRLSEGCSLTAITRDFCQRLGVGVSLLPMSDDSVQTTLVTARGDLDFQQYFVGEQCRPPISGYYFKGIENARPQQQMMALLNSDQLSAIIICPSNPFVSVAPILELAGVKTAMTNNPAPVIAVSPIVAGQAIKGPTAKMMAELGLEVSASAVADFYGDLLDGFVLDNADSANYSLATATTAVHHTNTVMVSLEDRIDLARAVVDFAESVAK